MNFQRFFRYITAFSNFQILKTVFLNAEFHKQPTRYLGYTRDRRKHDRSALTVPAPILACFLFAYVPPIVRPPEPAGAPWSRMRFPETQVPFTVSPETKEDLRDRGKVGTQVPTRVEPGSRLRLPPDIPTQTKPSWNSPTWALIEK